MSDHDGRTPIRSVGVVGAGVIGASVAHAVAQSTGLPVVLVDSDPDALRTAADSVRRQQRLSLLTGKGSRAAALDLKSTTNVDELSDVDVVVENITESQVAKSRLYKDLDRVLRPGVPIAANTSAIPIAVLAEPLTDPSRVVGVHFMNPVSQIATVEVVRAQRSSDEAMRAVTDLLRLMGKSWVEINDAAGFVINRVLMVAVNLAAAVVAEGVATPNQVDALFTGCLGHATGPLRTADLIGLDTVVHTLDVLHHHYATAEYVAHPALRERVARGELGCKSGRGFFSYGRS
ncbi:3-hydroxyacyl-CoA dehydrogenase [Saccharothrix coeruleofusca]|uniref:3-hydroxyacyl-CoA dehydrogenase family protein n=1 Tax=Saccharothrix coeruleofusca TaxID=33919 RepID=UPI001AE19FD6|nr:3-hydroxyacyl-CoA dehydrogenase family protein [Saccharothrix coeruleofusca]MBP2335998.1 3-hydroxyacyl-CoA dehydrogenase [Saccharothrix coeruleofusca]